MSTQPVGRRERKKAETRARIQQAALDLFERHGFAATSIEDITELADVSSTTFFRYFRTKDETVTDNGFTPVFLRALENQPVETDPLAAIREALRHAGRGIDADTWNRERRRQLLVLTDPDLRGPSVASIKAVFDSIAALVAVHVGREPDDPEVSAFTGAVLGIFGSVVLDPKLTVDAYLERLFQALDFLADGMPLTKST